MGQDYQWPEVEQVHEWFGKHPSDANTGELHGLLEAAHDNAANVPEGVFRAMAKHYDECTNGMLCPCGSKKTYSGCCKEDWIRVVRWRKKAQAERKEEQRKQPASKDSAKEDVEWLVRIGYKKETGEIAFDAVPGQSLQNLNPLALRDALWSVYRDVDASIAQTKISQMVYERVMGMLDKAAQARGASPGLVGPSGEPVKPM